MLLHPQKRGLLRELRWARGSRWSPNVGRTVTVDAFRGGVGAIVQQETSADEKVLGVMTL